MSIDQDVDADVVDAQPGHVGRRLQGRAGLKLSDDGGKVLATVTPGFVATEMVETLPEPVLERIQAQVPLGRLGRPGEIARVVHFLVADASSYIAGQVRGVNGGLDM